jgi:hypothetical protein
MILQLFGHPAEHKPFDVGEVMILQFEQLPLSRTAEQRILGLCLAAPGYLKAM